MFQADAAIPVEVSPSPNHGERRGSSPVDMLVLHYTGMHSGEDALARLCAPDSEVSTHYVIFEDGRIVQCVPEARRAWHAGAGYWRGLTDINSRSIGIELVNPGHEHGYRPFPDAQIASTVTLCRDILSRVLVPARNVVAHSDVAPTRKRDPGEKFPWDFLNARGIGIWVPPSDETQLDDSAETGPSRLRDYGYQIDEASTDSAALQAVVAAFQRHFRPDAITGRLDRGTLDTLNRLLTAAENLRVSF